MSSEHTFPRLADLRVVVPVALGLQSPIPRPPAVSLLAVPAVGDLPVLVVPRGTLLTGGHTDQGEQEVQLHIQRIYNKLKLLMKHVSPVSGPHGRYEETLLIFSDIC